MDIVYNGNKKKIHFSPLHTLIWSKIGLAVGRLKDEIYLKQSACVFMTTKHSHYPSLHFQVPRETPRQRGSSSSKCLWTWTQTATRSSTPTSPVPRTLRTSALCLRPSRTPSYSSTWKSTTWCERGGDGAHDALLPPRPLHKAHPSFGNVPSTPHASHSAALRLSHTHSHTNRTVAFLILIFNNFFFLSSTVCISRSSHLESCPFFHQSCSVLLLLLSAACRISLRPLQSCSRCQSLADKPFRQALRRRLEGIFFFCLRHLYLGQFLLAMNFGGDKKQQKENSNLRAPQCWPRLLSCQCGRHWLTYLVISSENQRCWTQTCFRATRSGCEVAHQTKGRTGGFCHRLASMNVPQVWASQSQKRRNVYYEFNAYLSIENLLAKLFFFSRFLLI